MRNEGKSLISVIVPIYNIELYVERCIESICDQTYNNLEIILVDDGSTDDSGKICDEFASKDIRITVIHKANGGLVSARKAGIRASTGEYITYVDGDDWIDCEAFSSMHQDMQDHEADIVIYEHFESVGDNDKQMHHSIPYGYYDKTSLMNNVYPNMIAGEDFFEWRFYTSVWGKLYKREVLVQSQLAVDERLTIGEDIACVIPAMYDANAIYVAPKCFYHYRQTTTSMVKTRSSIEEEREKFYFLYNYIKKVLEYNQCTEELYRKWIDFMLFIMIPRADNLYEGFDKLDYIFPFKKIKKGQKIALYCAGTYGQRLYSYLKDSGDAEVVVWVDQRYEDFRKLGLPVDAPESLLDYEFDAVIIATMFYGARHAIYDYIINLNIDVPVEMIDENYLKTEEVLQGLRL